MCKYMVFCNRFYDKDLSNVQGREGLRWNNDSLGLSEFMEAIQKLCRNEGESGENQAAREQQQEEQ